METARVISDNSLGIVTRKLSRMTKTANKDARKVLDEIAASIKGLVLDLENRETEGRRLTATEIQTIAGQLQVHVESLLTASRSLRGEKPEA
jgi:chromosome segregation and condensation protein ScpB